MKKILIISSYAPPSVSGTAINMYHMFKYFPPDSFVFLTSHQGITDSALKGGYKLAATYFYFDTPKLTTAPKSEKSLYQRLKNYVQNTVLLKSLVLTIFIFYLPFNIVRYSKKIIKDEKIEILLTYSDYGPALISTYLVHRMTKKPFFVHFYDMYYGNKLPFLYKMLAHFFEPKIFRDAEGISTMSEALAEYYQRKYKKHITVIHNAVSLENRGVPTQKEHDSSKPYKIIFTGAIYWAQEQAIKNAIQAVNELDKTNIQFWIYSTYSRENLNKKGIFESEKVFFSGGVPSSMVAIQKEADILFVPLSFDTSYSNIINTSSPGKTYEYMLSGSPILVHAPKESYIAKYAKQHNFALVVEENSVEALKKAIVALTCDKDLVKELTDNAFKTVISNHNAQKNSILFQSFFQ